MVKAAIREEGGSNASDTCGVGAIDEFHESHALFGWLLSFRTFETTHKMRAVTLLGLFFTIGVTLNLGPRASGSFLSKGALPCEASS